MNREAGRSAGSSPRSGAPRVVDGGLLLVLLAALLLLGLGFAAKSAAFRPGFDPNARPMLSYTDIVPLYHSEGLDRGLVPYVQEPNEYPVVTGLFMWAMALPGGGLHGFFLASSAALAILGLLTAWLLYRAVGKRALYFAAAPALLLYGLLNWDLLVVFLATAATVAFLRRRDGAAGVLLGLGAAAKVYPALLVIPFVLQRLGEGRRDRATRLALLAAGVWIVVNLPFALVSWQRWSFFFKVSSSRIAEWDTLWSVGCIASTGRRGCLPVPLMNVASMLLMAAAAVWVWRAKTARDPSFPPWTFGLALVVIFLLTNKVCSPQYSLWLIPWFALVLPDLRLFLAFELADTAVFATRLLWISGYLNRTGGLPVWPMEVAVVAKAAVLVWVLVDYVHTYSEPAPVAASTRPSQHHRDGPGARTRIDAQGRRTNTTP